MNMKAMRFGGTPLRSGAAGKYMCRHVLESSKTNKVIAVVLAMGRYPDAHATDTLPSMGSEFLTRQERVELASMGEQLSALKVCSELLDMGTRAYVFPFLNYGMLIDGSHNYAKVLKLDHTGIHKKLNSYDVLVVDDLIDISSSGCVTTLGRGGDDYDTVLFVGMLDLEEVDIYTDVDGVYDKDPKPSGCATKYDKLTYDEMLNMKSRALYDRYVNYAKDHYIRIYLKGTLSTGLGTVVED